MISRNRASSLSPLSLPLGVVRRSRSIPVSHDKDYIGQKSGEESSKNRQQRSDEESYTVTRCV